MIVLRTFLTFLLPKHQFVGLVSILHVKGFLLVLHRHTWWWDITILPLKYPSHIILNCDYLSIPRLYVPFHPAVYRISEEEAAEDKQSYLVDCLLYCK